MEKNRTNGVFGVALNGFLCMVLGCSILETETGKDWPQFVAANTKEKDRKNGK